MENSGSGSGALLFVAFSMFMVIVPVFACFLEDIVGSLAAPWKLLLQDTNRELCARARLWLERKLHDK